MAIEEALIGGAVGALIVGFLVLALIIFAGIYVYTALVFSKIAKKLKYKKHWLAWIPVARWFLIPILAGKHWTWGFLFFAPIANLVFLIIWMWKIYEKRKYPGALSLVFLGHLIPVIGWIVGIANLIILGFVAWKDQK